MDGVEVAGIVYVNAQTQTVPPSCLSRRVRFEIPGGEEDGEVVYVDAETQTLARDGFSGLGAGLVEDSPVLPDVLCVDARYCCGGKGRKNGKGKEGEVE